MITERALRGYIDHLGLALVVADAEKEPLLDFFPNGASSATRSIPKLLAALASDPAATLAARVDRDHWVLDVDTRHDGHPALAKLLAHFGPLPETWEAETPTGGRHIWFQGVPFRTKGKLANGCEVIRGNRLITLPPSERAGGVYRWKNHPLKTKLAAAPRWMLDDIKIAPTPVRVHETDLDIEMREKRARAWIAKADIAISGQHGSARTISVAVRIVRGFDLPKELALSVMQDWNRLCDPPWTDRDLKRKIDDAHRHGRMEWGAMLKPREARAA
jgi:hypothetical protein